MQALRFMDENAIVVYGAIASILIGLILGVVAIYLAYQSKSLLIGETADFKLVDQVEKLVRNYPQVEDLHRPITVHLSPHNVFLALEVQFKPDLQVSELTDVIDKLKKNIHKNHKSVKRIYIEISKLKDASDSDPPV